MMPICFRGVRGTPPNPGFKMYGAYGHRIGTINRFGPPGCEGKRRRPVKRVRRHERRKELVVMSLEANEED